MPHYSIESLVPEYLRLVKPYIPSRPDPELMLMYGCDHLYRLNNNENPLGPPRQALEALDRLETKRASIYPNGDAFYLRKALAMEYQMDENCFIAGNGANDLITAIIKAFCTKGDNIVTADKTFAVYEWAASYIGCDSKLIPLKDFGFDYDAFLAAINENTKIVFICNPNNPTSSLWSLEKVRSFLQAVDGRTIVVVDEAYLDYADDCRNLSAVNLLKEFPNLIVLKTFSKIYALAGLRIGYLIAGLEISEIIRRTIITYSINFAAQTAAEAIVGGGSAVHEHLIRSRTLAREGATMIRDCCESLSLNCRGDICNFMMIELPFSDTLAYRMLMEKGFMVRTMTQFRFPNWIRVTCSFADVIEPFCDVFSKIVSAHRKS